MKRMLTLATVLSLPLVTAALWINFNSHVSVRTPASMAAPLSLGTLIDDIHSFVSSDIKTGDTCASALGERYDILARISASSIALDDSKEATHSVIQHAFTTRLAIRDSISKLEGKGALSSPCLTTLRDLTRALRYIEDYMIERRMGADGTLGAAENYTTLQGEAPYFLVNPRYSDFKGTDDLHSGDVILSRGNAFTSAAIARIGSVDAQFSHISLVYRDEKGELNTTEAHIEIGVLPAPIRAHLDEHNSRTVVFRFHNPVLAHEAGKYMFEKATRYIQKHHHNISYDFAMDYQHDDEIFCSEVAYAGYLAASKGQVDIPSHKMGFNPGLIPFLNQIGIPVSQKNISTFNTFAPDDIEFDTRFDLVAEWRNPAKLKDSRYKDAIMTKVFEWMERDGYRFHPGAGITTKSIFAWIMRRMPYLNKQVMDKLPLNMKVKQLKVFLVLDKIGEALYKHIDEADRGSIPMTPQDIYRLLEDYREQDYARWSNGDDSDFHEWIHPKK